MPRVEWSHKKREFTYTKTKAGIRMLPLPQLLEDALIKYKNLSQDTFVIGLGQKPVTASWFAKHWAAWWRKHGYAHQSISYYTRVRNGKQYRSKHIDWIADVCAHQFRHEYVCMLCGAGVKEEIAI